MLTTAGITTDDLDPGVAELGADRLAQADDRVLGRAVGGAAGKPDLAGLARRC